ncbi:MAG: efflux RND transporter periplasmic adaptor subunit [Candidatus Marinimicrobia bacterium]|nr:efflux RND transporter periplasmic adaptor subunit [Candidatus Neomarinimicrobiota bacterium]
MVKVHVAKNETLREKLLLTGTVRAENVATILSAEEGKISRLPVREGDEVDSNSVVAMISPLLREDIINAARSAVQIKEAELKKNPGNAKISNELAQAREDYRFSLKQYKEKTVVSPLKGVVSQRLVDPGDMVPAKTKLFEVLSKEKLLVDVPVSEMDIAKLTRGQKSEIWIDAFPGRAFQGVLRRIHPGINTTTRHGLVEIELTGDFSGLNPGMFARVRFITRTLEDIIAIPTEAIIERPDHKACFIVRDGRAEEKILETGLETGGSIEIISGISRGDAIVIEGQQQLKTGAPVKIQAERTAPAKTERSEG